jgi:hypothetical protein
MSITAKLGRARRGRIRNRNRKESVLRVRHVTQFF